MSDIIWNLMMFLGLAYAVVTGVALVWGDLPEPLLSAVFGGILISSMICVCVLLLTED